MEGEGDSTAVGLIT